MRQQLIMYAELAKLAEMREEDIRMLDCVNLYGVGVEKDGSLKANFDLDMSSVARFRAANPEIKFTLMFTGENASEAFCRRARREKFADEMMALLLKWDLDGMDNDWEVPTMSLGAVKGRPEDKLTYTMLMRALRKRMDAEEARTGRHYLLTCAQSANLFVRDTVEIDQLIPLVDYISVMTYDMRGVHAFFELHDEKALPVGHHTNLYPSEGDDAGVCAERAVEIFRAWGVPDEKITFGSGLYPKHYLNVPGDNFGLMTWSHTGENYLEGALERSKLQAYLDNGYERHWDEAAQACWLYSPEKRDFISYEDEQSLAAKMAYLKREGLRGIIFWAYQYDDLHTLLPAAYHALRG